jgi:hypothetical protein
MKEIKLTITLINEVEKKVRQKNFMALIVTDSKERLKVQEQLMDLKIQWDSISTINFSMRVCKKSLIRRVVALQEVVDVIADISLYNQRINSVNQQSENKSMIVEPAINMRERFSSSRYDSIERRNLQRCISPVSFNAMSASGGLADYSQQFIDIESQGFEPIAVFRLKRQRTEAKRYQLEEIRKINQKLVRGSQQQVDLVLDELPPIRLTLLLGVSNRTWDPGGKKGGRHASLPILNSRTSFLKKGSLM